jgi:exoribonuclease R
MKALRDPQQVLGQGLAAIRSQFQIPDEFPAAVLAEAEAAARRVPTDHRDRTAERFVTLDPANSTDLDQAFAIEAAGPDIVLHYAIADVAWFVDEGGAIDREAWARGTTTYLPGGKAGLYPPVLAERAASLLPDGPRPAVVFTVRVDTAGAARLDGVERAVIHSRAKLAYERVRESDLPPLFADLAARIARAEEARGAARVDPPEQEVEADDQGRLVLQLRPQLQSERRNAALSLATNLAVADAMLAAQTGLFRVMPPPDARAVARLRRTAQAFALDWPEDVPLGVFERGLDPAEPRAAAFMLAVRRAGNGAAYAPYRPGETPWHAAMAASYAHATAPLRRLADRYVVRAALALGRGQPVPVEVAEAFERLPAAMAEAEAREGRIERAVIDLAEAALLAGREGEAFDALVTDIDERGGEAGARIQLCDLPVVARVTAHNVLPGARITVRLAEADPVRRTLRFARLS